MMDIVNYTALEYNSIERFFTPIYGDLIAPLAPVDALKVGFANSQVDLLFGVCNDEGTMFALNMFPEYASNGTHLTVSSVKKDIVHAAEVYKQKFGAKVSCTKPFLFYTKKFV